MLGGGTFTSQNKVLAGSYINFVSRSMATSALSNRGIVTMPLPLDWGVDGEVFEVTPADFQHRSLEIFGYAYDAPQMKCIREIFRNNIKKLYAYKLGTGAVAAQCTYATAKHAGVRGNALRIVISANADASTKFDVRTYLDGVLVDEQIAVTSAANLVNTNPFVTYKSSATLAVTAGTPLSGGTNGNVNGTAYQKYLEKIEPYSYNVMGCDTNDTTTKALLAAFCKRMRDEVGAKFQLVLYDYANADYEGIISVTNTTVGEAGNGNLVYWVTGAEGACAVNRTLLNQPYTGEFTVSTAYTQAQLEDAMQKGKFVFHAVGDTVRVLADINTLVTDRESKLREIFGDNQSIRVMDQIATDIAQIFNTKYLGNVPNDAFGRVSLWSDIVKHHKELVDLRAIEDFDSNDITVNQGEKKNSVVVTDTVTLVSAMAKLYMTVTVL